MPDKTIDPAAGWAQWDDFLRKRAAAGFMQSSWWADFRTIGGYQHFAAVLRHEGQIVGGAIVMRFEYDDGRYFYYIPEGPVLPADQDLAAAVFQSVVDSVDDDARNLEATVSHLRIEPRWTAVPRFVMGFEPKPAFMDAFMEPRDTLCIDLRPATSDILAQMKPKGRYNIRVAQRHGVTVSEDCSAAGLADFIDIYNEMAERQGVAPKPPDYFEELLRRLDAERQGTLFFAEHRSERLAAALVVYFGGRATYFFGASRNRRRQVMAPYLLHLEIMRTAKRRCCDWYDLWGVSPADSDSHPWRNISRFKRKFGGSDVRLVPTLDRVHDTAAYRDYLADYADQRIIARAAPRWAPRPSDCKPQAPAPA